MSMDLPPGLQLSFEKDPSWENREVVDEGLGVYNAPFLRDPRFSHDGSFSKLS